MAASIISDSDCAPSTILLVRAEDELRIAISGHESVLECGGLHML